MPSSVEHKVEMHRLARERQAAGLPVWDRKIRLADVFRNPDMTFEERRDAIVARLRASVWLKGYDEDSDLTQFVDEMSEAADVEEFDGVWDFIYDIADADRVWIETRR
jgi:hypothetical protein